jgi:Fe-coproporphyrin III synthase
MRPKSNKNKSKVSISTIIDQCIVISKAPLYRKLNMPILPRYCNFSVTYLCNHKCYMCEIWRKKEHNDLSLNEIKKIFSDKSLRKLRMIRLTGGEPFIRNDIVDIVKIIKSKTNVDLIAISTNGLLSNKIIDSVKQILNLGVKLEIKISLEGNEKTHDKVRGIKGAYKKAMETLIGLKKLKSKQYFYVGVNQTITRHNEDQINYIYDLSKNHGCGYHPALAIAPRPVYTKGTGVNEGLLNPEKFALYDDFNIEEIKKFLNLFKEKRFDRDKTQSKGLGIAYIHQLIWDFYHKGFYNRLVYQKEDPTVTCMTLFTRFRIEPNGDIAVCSYKPQVIGNLKQKSFTKIWCGKTASRFRKVVKNCPGCWGGCEVQPDLAYSPKIIKYAITKILS